MGKSRLCAEFAREVHATGATVLYGRCDEESLAPYQPFVEALRHYVAVCPQEELRAQAGPSADDLARLVPDLARRVPGVTVSTTGIDAEADRLRLFEAVTSLLAEASVEQTVVLFLDDLHWADRPTLQLVRHLLRAQPFPILLVATYRETDLDRTHPLSSVLADLRREHQFERLHLKGLDTDEIVLSLERAAGQDIGRRGRRLAEALESATDGNPFFIIQILGHLTDTGRIYEQDGIWTFDVHVDELGIPEGVKEVVGRRISSLSEGANKALGVAAVLGRDFSLEILERVADMTVDELVDALDEAVRAGIVLEARGAHGRYSFAHALVRETLYEELTATRRVRLHRRTASVLEELAGGDEDRFVSELAYHYLEAAQVTEVDKAIDYARRAAKRAVALIAYEEGVRLYERAIGAHDLGEEPDDSLRLDLLLELGDAQWKAGDALGSRETFEHAQQLARKLEDRERFAEAALGFVGPPESGFPRMSGIDALEEVLERLPSEDSKIRARVSVRLAMFFAADPANAERRATLAREAVEMSQRIGDMRTIAYVLRAAALALWEPNNLAREIELADEVIRLGEQEGDKELVAYGNGWRSIWLLWTGDADASDDALAIQGALGAQLKQPFMRWAHMMWTACRKQMRGELEEAESLANEAFELGQQVVPDAAVPIFAVQVAAIRWLQGRFAEVEPVVKAQVEAFPEIPAWRCTLANIYAETDQRDKAREEFERLAADGFPIPRDAAWPIAIGRLCMIAAYLGDRERAETLYELLEPYSGQNVVVAGAISSAGAVDRYLGLAAATMSKWELAEKHFRDSIEQNERMRARPFVAFTYYDYADMLLRRGNPGDDDRANAYLDQALAIASEIGMTKLEERIVSAREETPALD
jgi:tetratricopeptide (TPR) repeat protein